MSMPIFTPFVMDTFAKKKKNPSGSPSAMQVRRVIQSPPQRQQQQIQLHRNADFSTTAHHQSSSGAVEHHQQSEHPPAATAAQHAGPQPPRQGTSLSSSHPQHQRHNMLAVPRQRYRVIQPVNRTEHLARNVVDSRYRRPKTVNGSGDPLGKPLLVPPTSFSKMASILPPKAKKRVFYDEDDCESGRRAPNLQQQSSGGGGLTKMPRKEDGGAGGGGMSKYDDELNEDMLAVGRHVEVPCTAAVASGPIEEGGPSGRVGGASASLGPSSHHANEEGGGGAEEQEGKPDELQEEYNEEIDIDVLDEEDMESSNEGVGMAGGAAGHSESVGTGGGGGLGGVPGTSGMTDRHRIRMLTIPRQHGYATIGGNGHPELMTSSTKMMIQGHHHHAAPPPPPQRATATAVKQLAGENSYLKDQLDACYYRIKQLETLLMDRNMRLKQLLSENLKTGAKMKRLIAELGEDAAAEALACFTD